MNKQEDELVVTPLIEGVHYGVPLTSIQKDLINGGQPMPNPNEPLREKIHRILTSFETTVLATRGSSYHRAYARNEVVTDLEQLIADAQGALLDRLADKKEDGFNLYSDDELGVRLSVIETERNNLKEEVKEL